MFSYMNEWMNEVKTQYCVFCNNKKGSTRCFARHLPLIQKGQFHLGHRVFQEGPMKNSTSY